MLDLGIAMFGVCAISHFEIIALCFDFQASREIYPTLGIFACLEKLRIRETQMTQVNLRHLRKAGGALYFWLELDSICAGTRPRVGDNHCFSQNSSRRPILAHENGTTQGNSIRCGAKERGDLCGIRRVR